MKKAKQITNGNVNLQNLNSGFDKPGQITIDLDKIVMTDTMLDSIITMAFKSGENWGVTYSGWFQPTQEDHSDKLDTVREAIYNTLKHNRKVITPNKK